MPQNQPMRNNKTVGRAGTRNGRQLYKDGSQAWTAIVEDETQEDLGEVFSVKKKKPGAKAGGILADTPLRRFLFLKIPIEVGRTRATEILVDAWRSVEGPGKADWELLKKQEEALIEEAVSKKTFGAGLRHLMRGVPKLDKLTQETVAQVRKRIHAPYATKNSNRAKDKRALTAMIKKRVKALWRNGDGEKIESALGTVADELHISVGTVSRPVQLRRSLAV